MSTRLLNSIEHRRCKRLVVNDNKNISVDEIKQMVYLMDEIGFEEVSYIRDFIENKMKVSVK